MSSWSIAVLAVLAIGVTPVLLTYHPISAYDNQHVTTLTGTVAEFKWMHPHPKVALNVRDEKGRTERWTLLMERPGVLKRYGWNPNTLQVGEEITTQVHVRKDGLKIARARKLILANGNELQMVAAK